MLKINMSPFTDNKRKIKPELASDWKIEKTSKNDSIQVVSKELNIEFTIPTESFIKDIIRLDLVMIGNKLQGTFLFDGKRNIYTDQEVFQFNDENEDASRKSFQKEDLIVGESYVDSEDNKVVFLGTKYIAKSKHNISYLVSFLKDVEESITKITKKHLFINKEDVNSKYVYRQIVKESYKGKLVAIDPKNFRLSKEKIEGIIKRYKERARVVYYEDYTISDPKWEIKEGDITLV